MGYAKYAPRHVAVKLGNPSPIPTPKPVLSDTLVPSLLPLSDNMLFEDGPEVGVGSYAPSLVGGCMVEGMTLDRESVFSAG